jgi:cation:H+ antiporter
MDFVILIVSLAALIYGADFVIKESEKIALHFDIQPFIIGATVVALGTSLPEMAASISASFKDQSQMAVANVVGSVVFNILLVLGFVFLVGKKIMPKRDIFAKDSAWGLFPIFIFFIMATDGVLSFLDGILFICLMVAYVMFLSSDAKNLAEMADLDDEDEKENFKWGSTIILLSIGFIFVIVGANFTIDSAASIAKSFGVSEWIIGMFLIAFGTSLPEFVVGVKAAMNNQADMAIGAIIGSNVANFSMVLGAAAMVNNISIDLSAIHFDLIVATIASVMLVFVTANKLYSKSAGMVFLITLILFIEHSAKLI